MLTSRSATPAVGLVPGARAGDGAARPGAGVALGAACCAASTRSAVATRRSTRWSNLADLRRLPGRRRRRYPALAVDFDPRRRPAVVRRRRVLVVFMATNTLNFLMIASVAAVRFRRAARDMIRAVVRHRAAVASSRPALLTAGVAFTYGISASASVGLAAVVLFVFLYIAADERAGRGARRGADAAHARARLAADGAALDRAADAVDARRDDRAPLRRRRPLLARGRGDAGPRRARAGPDPHRRAAARHRQVHPPRLRPVRRTASSPTTNGS